MVLCILTRVFYRKVKQMSALHVFLLKARSNGSKKKASRAPKSRPSTSSSWDINLEKN